MLSIWIYIRYSDGERGGVEIGRLVYFRSLVFSFFSIISWKENISV